MIIDCYTVIEFMNKAHGSFDHEFCVCVCVWLLISFPFPAVPQHVGLADLKPINFLSQLLNACFPDGNMLT